jgi:hypothetical protein
VERSGGGGIAPEELKRRACLGGSRYHEHGPAQNDFTQACLGAGQRNHEAQVCRIGRHVRRRQGLKSKLATRRQGLLLDFQSSRFVALRAQRRRRLGAQGAASEHAMVTG